MPPSTQQAVVQAEPGASQGLPMAVSATEPVADPATLPSPFHALIRVRAVALNPNDHKIPVNFPQLGGGVGCDFCGIVEAVGEAKNGSGEDGAQTNASAATAITTTNGDGPASPSTPDATSSRHKPGTRVCGALFPYGSTQASASASAPVAVVVDDQIRRMGAFSEWVVADSRLLLEVPPAWSDLQGAALGGVGWSTLAMAMSHSTALALAGRPSCPSAPAGGRREPVLVYGGGTATGTMACQLLKHSGYDPIAVTHTEASSTLSRKYGAQGVVSGGVENPRMAVAAAAASVAAGGNAAQLRHVLDCITDADSARFCFDAVARTGGRYACLEQFRETWQTRRAVKTKEVMGFEVLGYEVDLGGAESTYSRKPEEEAVALGRMWAGEMQTLLDKGLLEPHPVREISRGWESVLEGMEMLRAGKVRGVKLVSRVSE